MITYVEWLLVALTAFLVLLTAMPLMRWQIGAIRGPAFFRLQLFWVAGGVAVLAYLLPVRGEIALINGLIAAIQLGYIVKFTALWRRQSLDADAELRADTARHISILAANIKKSNRNYDVLIHLVDVHAPDILLAIEVDSVWIDALKSALSDDYPHWVSVPEETGYGMAVISKLALSETDVREVVTEGVPSVRTAVTLRAGGQVRLYVVHPEPPVFSHDTLGRDSEIAHIGLEAQQDPMPAIVTGDLNDVAWSRTTRVFQRLSGLLDPRVGRGFYNTFHAFHWWARWPLDHLFHDPQFRVLSIARLPKIGSDHFPMLFALALADGPAQKGEVASADVEEKAEAREMIRKEQDRERDPIGTDWED
ncbi:endonuclease/exonuclease/phosphatase family protein [uncultured Sulfitobacter sp.]|uniref:endonuclease/exonuclease/phosphatase family protein n=1 Tax=uncultured Sulfitobacter sp. TaxID=191468 RepID=UPI00262AEFD6|nr:endonuclease/exonuclease/phosphatase family protein [uncultured Sulfitobacter sp.]